MVARGGWSLFERAVDVGWDDEHGGLSYTVDFDGSPANPDHYWWPIAEGIGASAFLLQLTGDLRRTSRGTGSSGTSWDPIYRPRRGGWYPSSTLSTVTRWGSGMASPMSTTRSRAACPAAASTDAVAGRGRDRAAEAREPARRRRDVRTGVTTGPRSRPPWHRAEGSRRAAGPHETLPSTAEHGRFRC